MLEETYIHKSVISRLRTIFSEPPVGIWPYTVYNEDQLRQAVSGALKPVDHRVFLLEAYTRPVPPILPLVILETGRARKQPFELGNQSGRRTDCQVHILGRMVGERKDLSSFVADYMGVSVPIYNYLNGSSAYVEDGLVVEGFFDIEEIPMKRDDFRQDSSLDLWTVVRFTLLTLH